MITFRGDHYRCNRSSKFPRAPAENRLATHHVGCRQILARQSIEQHAHIPYTHGWPNRDRLATRRIVPLRMPSKLSSDNVFLISAIANVPLPPRFAIPAFSPRPCIRTVNIPMASSIIAQYAAGVAAGKVERDPAQLAVVDRLAHLESEIIEHRLARKSSSLGWLFARDKKPAAAEGPVHLRRRRPRQDHADGFVLSRQARCSAGAARIFMNS